MYTNHSQRYIAIGNRITKERERLGFTQERFLEYMESHGMYFCSRTQLSRIENGVEKSINSLKLSDWLNLCSVFRVDIEYLLGEQELRNRDDQFIQDKTGLSERAIHRLIDIHAEECPPPEAHVQPNGFIDALSTFIENESFIELMNLLLQRYSHPTLEELHTITSTDARTPSEAIRIARENSATIVYPDNIRSSVPVADLATSMIISTFMKMIPPMNEHFRDRYHYTVPVTANEIYRTYCYIIGHESCLSDIRSGRCNVRVGEEWQPLTEEGVIEELLYKNHVHRAKDGTANLTSPLVPNHRIPINPRDDTTD